MPDEDRNQPDSVTAGDLANAVRLLADANRKLIEKLKEENCPALEQEQETDSVFPKTLLGDKVCISNPGVTCALQETSCSLRDLDPAAKISDLMDRIIVLLRGCEEVLRRAPAHLVISTRPRRGA